jgi:hypothetical protein
MSSMRVLLCAAVLAVLFVPVEGIPVAGYLRGLAGDLSVTTLLLLSSSVVSFAFGESSITAASLPPSPPSSVGRRVPVSRWLSGSRRSIPTLGYAAWVRILLLGLAPVALVAWWRGRLSSRCRFFSLSPHTVSISSSPGTSGTTSSIPGSRSRCSSLDGIYDLRSVLQISVRREPTFTGGISMQSRGLRVSNGIPIALPGSLGRPEGPKS